MRLNVPTTWPAPESAALRGISNVSYHLFPSRLLKTQLLWKCFYFDSREVTVSFITVSPATVNLKRAPLDSPPSCCTTVISHLFCVSHKACVGRAVFIPSAAISLGEGVFPRVILIYSSVEPAHCCLDGYGVVAYSCIHPTRPLSCTLPHPSYMLFICFQR